MNNDLTLAQYDASKHPEVRALRNMAADDLAGRLARAQELMSKGFVLDVIDVAGHNPLWAMASRLQLGEFYWPNFSQPQPITIINAAGLLQAINYDLTQDFPGAIRSSTDAADYLPFDVTPPPVPLALVGPYIGNGEWGADLSVVWKGGIWQFALGASVHHTGMREGVEWTGTLYFHKIWGLTGPAARWVEAKQP